MRSTVLGLGMIGLLGLVLWSCSPRSETDCIKLTPTSRRCSSPQWFAEPPPAAQAPPGLSSAWTLTTAERAVSGYAPLRETIWTAARPPCGQSDFIALHRITRKAEGNSAAPRRPGWPRFSSRTSICQPGRGPGPLPLRQYEFWRTRGIVER